MEYSFLEFMKRIGIFIICAQSIIHFSAEKSYERYVKILVGIMLLAQFIVPVRALFLGADNSEILENVSKFQKEMEAAMENTDVVYEGIEVTDALQEEIKGKLKDIAEKYGYGISEVTLYSEDSKNLSYNDTGEYVEPSKLVVQVYEQTADNDTIHINSIQKVDNIDVTVDTRESQEITDTGPDKNLEEMKKEFCISLGTDEAYVEVRIG